MLPLGRPIDHYKLLPWLCYAIVRANPNSRAFCELEGARFKCISVAYGASLNGFIMGCQKVLFVDRAHLIGPYKGTLLAVIMLNAGDHLFDVAYVVVVTKDKEEWFWFLSVLAKCLGGLKPMIMSDHHDGLLYDVLRVFGAKNHCYCLRHLRENFVKWLESMGFKAMHQKSL